MARSLDKALLELLARFRARRRGPASLLLLAVVLVAQTALVVHRIDHNSADHAVCTACVAADQSADAASTPLFVSIPQAPMPVATTVAASAGSRTLVSYRSRAPPERLQA